MRTFSLMLLALGLWGCGDHIDYNLGTPSATRGADDHVTVTVAVICDVTGSGDCSNLGSFCLDATWQSAAGDGGTGGSAAGDGGTCGTVIDQVQVCHPGDLKADLSQDVLTLRSDVVIPHDPSIEISLALNVQPVAVGADQSATLPSP
jgi:hypothetical protein